MNMLTPTGHIGNDSNADHHHTPKMFFDLTYLRTPSGMLKILQAADGLFGYLCMRVVTKSYDFPAGRYYEFVALLGFVMALNLGFLHMIHVTDVTSKTIPWVLIELIYSLVWSFLCCIAGGIIASWAEYHTALAFSAFFAFLGTFLYGYETVEKSKLRRREASSADRQRSRGGSCVTIS